ncbi:MAG: hypothetical protein ACE5F1_11860 [Planctomycetota bacterium]
MEDQHATVDRLVRIFEIPGEECSLLPAIGEREHLPPFLWQELVKRGGDDRVGTVRSMRDFADGILRSVAAPATPANLILVALPLRLEDETEVRTMAARRLHWLGRLSADPATLRAEIDETGIAVPGSLVHGCIERPIELDLVVLLRLVAKRLGKVLTVAPSDEVMLPALSTQRDLERGGVVSFRTASQ